MAILMFKVRTDARNVYFYGNYPLSTIMVEYQEPVKKYAGETFTLEQIDNALAQGWITQEEYNQTIAYRPVV